VAKKKATPEVKKIAVKQVRSRIGRPGKHRRTLEALGIKRHQQTVIHDDTPAIRGMIEQVSHLVEVTDVQE
jgi:large subunit ribosomal protein L30